MRCLDAVARLILHSVLPCWVLLGSAAASAADGEISIHSVVEAVQKRICYDIALRNRTWFNTGAFATLFVRRHDGRAHVWSKDLISPADDTLRETYHLVDHIGSHVVAIASRSWNPEDKYEYREHESDKSLIFDHDFETVRLRVPTDCTHKIEPDTPEKTRRMTEVLNTVVKTLVSIGTHRDQYPETLIVKIKDFNIHYPTTYAYVPYSDELIAIGMINDFREVIHIYPEDGHFLYHPIYGVFYSDMEKELREGNWRDFTVSIPRNTQ